MSNQYKTLPKHQRKVIESTMSRLIRGAVEDEKQRIIKLLEEQEVEGWFDRGLKQHFIALIKGENK